MLGITRQATGYQTFSSVRSRSTRDCLNGSRNPSSDRRSRQQRLKPSPRNRILSTTKENDWSSPAEDWTLHCSRHPHRSGLRHRRTKGWEGPLRSNIPRTKQYPQVRPATKPRSRGSDGPASRRRFPNRRRKNSRERLETKQRVQGSDRVEGRGACQYDAYGRDKSQPDVRPSRPAIQERPHQRYTRTNSVEQRLAVQVSQKKDSTRGR